MKTRITESDINRIIQKVMKEDKTFVTGISASERTELVDDVINRINEHGDRYINALNKLNFDFPVERYRRQERIRKSDVVLPKGVRVQSSVFGDE